MNPPHTMNNGDVIFGTIATSGSLVLSSYNLFMGCVAITLTVAILALRLRKAWRNRDQ
jgi:hypothetical protein